MHNSANASTSKRQVAKRHTVSTRKAEIIFERVPSMTYRRLKLILRALHPTNQSKRS